MAVDHTGFSNYQNSDQDYNEELDSDNLVQLTNPADFSTHFEEWNGRLFLSHGRRDQRYELPVDGVEQRRMRLVHRLFKNIFGGANYIGPVGEVLSGEHRLVLDLGTGTGEWVKEMAVEFPRVTFWGIDIAPIATQYPPPNAQFLIHNIYEGLGWGARTVNFVHARWLNYGVKTLDYCALLSDVARVLRPGGMFLSCEWGHNITFHPNYHVQDVRAAIPDIIHFLEEAKSVINRNVETPLVAERIPAYIGAGNAFTRITSTQHWVPIGGWADTERETGVLSRRITRAYTEAVRPVFIRAGWTEEDFCRLANAFVAQVYSNVGLIAVVHTVHARRT